MTRNEKNQMIAELSEAVSGSNVFYLTDASGLDADSTSTFRRECFKSDVTVRVVKNTLLLKAMEAIEGKDFSPMYDTLKGNTAVMFSSVGNVPAKLIKEFRKKHDKPILKAAYIEESIYIGHENLDKLVDIKSKEELIGEIIGLLQSPAKNVISALQSGGSTIAGIVKTLSEREN